MIPLLAVMLLVLLVVTVSRRSSLPRNGRVGTESLIHRCDFCKEAILPSDDAARCFVRHAEGERPLLGYSVVNVCGACVRERRFDGAFSEGAEPPS